MNAAWVERVQAAWEDLRDHPGRGVLQSLGVVLGVASVVGGFSITDSFRRQAEQRYVRTGGLDKLTVYPEAGVRGGQPSALQGANLGLRSADAERGAALAPRAVAGVSVVREVHAMVRTHSATWWRVVTGINADFIPMEAYVLERGRAFASGELQAGAPVAILGSEAARTFFPDGDAPGRTLVMDGVPVAVVGTFQPKVFRFLESDPNLFAWRNRTIAVPAAFVQKRLLADPHLRLDVITFRVPDTGRIEGFSLDLAALLRASHRFQTDFRLDDVAARHRREQRQGAVYDLVFMLSGLLALLGGGLVNVNNQLAALRERVREVGLRMALGASGREVFKAFMTEALLLTALGAAVGLGAGALFAWVIAWWLGVPLYVRPDSFLWAFLLAGAFGFAFALVPAWKAARLSPMEALRCE